jgi:hypothetical protein
MVGKILLKTFQIAMHFITEKLVGPCSDKLIAFSLITTFSGWSLFKSSSVFKVQSQ